ncbi:hypothetical protein EVAR_13359_1 [Eumeta japonica]|uniref:Uncharacterized protein n=1 Tax=Eumeta variegata TaxID=151549 RepID=A0A4C1TRW3_EUMVA|nr:hypothetical protein EVAR_13359_1 [Eumeta japonica]
MVDWDLVFIATLAEEEEESNQSRRFWVNNLWKQRYTPAAYRRMPKHPEAFSRLPIQQPQAYRSVVPMPIMGAGP